MARLYNFIYTQLVESEDDVLGHVAYSLYKADKVAFIETFKKEHGNAPSETELESFHQISCLPGSIERYRLMANNILGEMMTNTMKDTIQEIEKQCLNNHKQMLAEVIKPLEPKNFWYGVMQSVAAAFIFALILAAIGFITLFKTNDINISVTTQQGQSRSVTLHATDSIPE